MNSLTKKTNHVFTKKNLNHFSAWILKNSQLIIDELIEQGTDFILEHCQNLRHNVLRLELDNRWHYLDKAKKEGYRGSLEFYNSVPYLKLTYHSFKDGGVNFNFNSKEVLKELWQEDQSLTKTWQANKIVTKKEVITKVTKNNKQNAEAVEHLNKAEKLWQNLNSKGSSAYLIHKNINVEKILGLRFGKNFITSAIIDINNVFQGLQTIYDNGQKFFNKGLAKKGNFALIGLEKVPNKIKEINICEGLATAISIYLATGKPVFVALDAFNLLPVGKNLKNHFPNRPITIWADNDWQKVNKVLNNGKLLGNTGLIHANYAAFKLRNAKVCIPDFNSLTAEEKKEATDFNDLHKFSGLETIRNTEAELPNLNVALSKKQEKYQAQTHAILSPKNFSAPFKKYNHTCRFLPQIDFKEGVYLIASPIGSGKTQVVENFVKVNPEKKIIFITYLISLVESAAKRLNLASYNDCDVFDLMLEKRLAICLNSLIKLTIMDYEIVIIDEIEQLINRLTTELKQKAFLLDALISIIRNSKTLICLDAHLSEKTINLIKEICPEKAGEIHYNEYAVAKEMKLYRYAESLQTKAIKKLKANKKIFLAFNSKEEARKLMASLQTIFPDKKGLLASSDNHGDKANQEFFHDVNSSSKLYDYILCTPALATGVSIDNEHFDFVGGIFSAQINTANDCMQAIGRVRNQKQVHVHLEARKGSLPLDKETISAKWTHTHNYDLNLMRLDHETQKKVLLNEFYEEIMVLVTKHRNRSFNDFQEQFLLLALTDNYKISYNQQELTTEERRDLKALKKACLSLENNNIVDLNLTPEQLKELAYKNRKTLAETKAHHKYQLKEFFNLANDENEELNQLLTHDNKGKLRKQIANVELALGDLTTATDNFKKQLEKEEKFAADLNYSVTLQELFHKILTTLKVDYSGKILKYTGFRYDKEIIIKSALLEWLDENRQRLSGVINLPSLEKLKENPLRFISLILRQLNLKQKRVGRALKGQYQLVQEQIDFVNSLLKRRQQDCNAKLKILAKPLLDFKTIITKGIEKFKAFFKPPPLLTPLLI